MKKPSKPIRYIILLLTALSIFPEAGHAQREETPVSPPFTVGLSEERSPATAAVVINLKKGVLIPRLSAAQRRLIAVDSSAVGLTVYQIDKKAGYYAYDGRSWVSLMPVQDLLGDTLLAGDFAAVAFTGAYDDLINKPNIRSDSGSGVTTLAKVAVTGSYNDLTGRPVIPESIPELAKVAYTGDYGDMSNVPAYPTHLKELSTDDYYMTVSLAETQRWERHAATTVPHRLSDLKSDEYAQSVSDMDKRRWDSASQRAIPTRLRELRQDSLHRTVTQEEIERWQTASKKEIPTKVSDLTSDEYYMPVTLAEKEAWERHAATPIPTKLSDLTQSYTAQTVSDEDIIRWDQAAAMGHFSGSYNDLRNKPAIATSLRDLKPDDDHNTVTESEISRWTNYANTSSKLSVADYASSINNASGYYTLVSENDKCNWNEAADLLLDTLSTAAQQNDFSLLTNRPDYAEVMYSGRYADLKDVPDFKTAFIRSNSINDLRNTPDVKSWPKLWTSCSFNDVKNHPVYATLALKSGCTWGYVSSRPTKLSDLVPDNTSVHITSGQKSVYDNIVKFYNGTLQASESQLQGSWVMGNLSVTSSPVLGGHPTLSDSRIPTDTAGGGKNRIVTIGALKQMDKAYAENLKATADAYPEGTVLIRSSLDNLPEGWCEFTQLKDRFPVAVNNGQGAIEPASSTLTQYSQGATGGSSSVILTTDHIPSHNHKVSVRVVSMPGKDWNTSPKDTYIPSGLEGKEGTLSNYVTTTGGGRSHENRPPYQTVYFIIKSATCPNY